MAKNASNLLSRALYDHCAAKPDAVEDHPWGETVFKIRGKVFAFLGSGEEAGVTVKAPAEELDGLLLLSFIRRSPYIGRYGWVRVYVENEDALDVALRLIDQSYEFIETKAPGKKRKAAKDEKRPSDRPKRKRKS
jgi:predicted DNA-binding protein (MmcQ/YjbR family)